MQQSNPLSPSDYSVRQKIDSLTALPAEVRYLVFERLSIFDLFRVSHTSAQFRYDAFDIRERTWKILNKDEQTKRLLKGFGVCLPRTEDDQEICFFFFTLDLVIRQITGCYSTAIIGDPACLKEHLVYGEKYNLVHLADSYCKPLSDLPAAMRNVLISRGTEISCESLNITGVPEAIKEFINVSTLMLTGNPLRFFPEGIRLLTSLKHLSLCLCRLARLPEWMGELSSLETLSLSENKIGVLPEGMRGLNKVRIFHFNDNRLREVPTWIGEWVDLAQLNLDGNNLTDLPEGVKKLGRLTVINLNRNKFTVFPEALRGNPTVQFISMSGNQLATLPEWVVKLPSLKQLDISFNKLTTVPDWLVKSQISIKI